MNKKNKILRQGEVYYAFLPEKENSCIQGGYRPIVIWSNDKNNTHSTIYNYYAISAKTNKVLPVHPIIKPYFLSRESIVLCEQPRTDDEADLFTYIDWKRGCIGRLSDNDMYKIFVGQAIQSGGIKYLKYSQQYAMA